ncbi:hypothetical protein EJB05_19080, partial [Eragrostis curvula]
MPPRDHVSWTSVIGASPPAQAVALFRQMLLAAVRVDGVVLVVLLRASAALRDVHLGSSLHATAARRGLLAEDVFVANSLVHMYSECLRLRSARKVFDSIAQKNIVSWNTMLTGLLHADRCAEALHLLQQHRHLLLHVADATTLAVLLQLCKKLALPLLCRSLHAYALRKLLLMASHGTPLLNALLDAYAKCGLLGHALALFRRMPLRDRNVVTWSTVIAACAGSGRPRDAVACFAAMREAGQRPNAITMLSLLEACAGRAMSRCAHGVALRCGLASDQEVGNALVDTYGKCGNLAGARRVFDAMPVRDVVSWNSMIGALGMNGRASDALALVGQMHSGGTVKPNGVTLLAVLSACAHGGLVQEGVACLESTASTTSTWGMELDEENLSCVVDMLARAGHVEAAAKIAAGAAAWSAGHVEAAAKIAAGAAAWSAVLSGCRARRNVHDLGREAARRVLELEPGNSAGYLLATGVVDDDGDVVAMWRTMRDRGVKVTGGYSMVHVAVGRHEEEHRFASWDARHPQRVQVYAMLHLLHRHMTPPPDHDL